MEYLLTHVGDGTLSPIAKLVHHACAVSENILFQLYFIEINIQQKLCICNCVLLK